MKKIIPLLDIKVDGKVHAKGKEFECEEKKAEQLVKTFLCKYAKPDSIATPTTAPAKTVIEAPIAKEQDTKPEVAEQK